MVKMFYSCNTELSFTYDLRKYVATWAKFGLENMDGIHNVLQTVEAIKIGLKEIYDT